MDFASHNREVRLLWRQFEQGDPWRTPVVAGVSSRFILMDPSLNRHGYSFQDYMESPQAMLDVQLDLERFRRFEIDDDTEKGVPEEGWGIAVDFHNVYDAAWLGAEVYYPEGEVPRVRTLLTDGNKYDFLKERIPDPFSGIMGRAKGFFAYFDAAREKRSFEGAPIGRIDGCPLWTDGPFTTACLLRGTESFLIDLMEEPEYARALLMYLTKAIILRQRAWREYRGEPLLAPHFSFADDMIQLISVQMLREFLVPCYLALAEGLSVPGTTMGIHLCGDAMRHMIALRDILHLDHLDTGFPMDFGYFARAIGPNVCWQGGPHVSLLRYGGEEEIRAEVRRILDEVRPFTRRFVLRDANDIAPRTPLRNIRAMVDAGREYGVYRDHA